MEIHLGRDRARGPRRGRRRPPVPRVSPPALAAVLGAGASLLAALTHARPPLLALATGLALGSGWLARRPARRSRSPRVDEIRSLVLGTLGMAIAVAAAGLAALPYARTLAHL